MLPINLENLLHTRTIERSRLEFKNGLSEPQLFQVIKTVTAFANDFHNLNGGYIIIGLEEMNGVAQFPPLGIAPNYIDEYQKKIRGQLNRIEPEYYPLVEPVEYQEKLLLVIWCPAGEARPYKAPIVGMQKDKVYYVRQGSETVEAKGEILKELLSQTARIPFDDRAFTSLDYDILSPILVKKYLKDVRSRLAEIKELTLEVFQDMRIVKRINGHYAPLNVGLLFFYATPEEYIPCAKTEVVQFGDDAGGNLIEEKTFSGPLAEQLQSVLHYLESFSTTIVEKTNRVAAAGRTEAFPFAAMEEALVNAYFHRGYDVSREPIKIYLYPDRMEIISYPGPVPGIKLDHFTPGNRVPPVPNRNRRIGEFLKELRLAEMRNTGIPKIIRSMSENGSPPPQFDFDEERTYFRVTLPAHPDYVVLQSLRDSSYLWAVGQPMSAIRRLEETIKNNPAALQVYEQLIDYKCELNDLIGAEKTLAEMERHIGLSSQGRAYLLLARAYMQNDEPGKAISLLSKLREQDLDDNTLISLAVNYKKVNQLAKAHQVFSDNESRFINNPRALNEYADVKFKLAREAYQNKKSTLNRKLLEEAASIYRRVIHLTDDITRKGWCWFRLAEIYELQRKPVNDVENAHLQAVEALPNEQLVREQYQKWRSKYKREL